MSEKVKVKLAQSCLTLSDPMDCIGNSPGQITGVGSRSLLQGIFPTQGSNPGFPHYRQILYQLSHQAMSEHIVNSYYIAASFIIITGKGNPWSCKLGKCIELVKKCLGFPINILWKNLNEVFGQPNRFNKVKQASLVQAFSDLLICS